MNQRLVIWAVLLPVTVSAAELSAPSFPLSQALQEARERNPEIKAAKAESEAAKARIIPEKTWAPPQVGLEYWGFHGADIGAVPERWVDLSQDIPFPGKLHFRGEAAAHEARRQEEVYKGIEWDVLTRVKDAYYRYLFATKAHWILEENVEVMRRFSKTAEAKYITGKESQSDVLRAQVELSKTLAAIVELDQEQDAAQANLNALLDRSPDEPVGMPEEPSVGSQSLTYQDLERVALAHRPEVLSAEHHIRHTTSLLKAERAEYLPDFSAQYSRRTRDGMPSDSIAIVKMSLPFLYFWRQDSQINAASAELNHAQSMLRSVQDETRSDAKAAWTKVQEIGRLVDLYRTGILPQAEQSVKVSEAGYQADRVDFLSLMDSQRALLEFRLDYEKYLSQYGQSVGELERALGVELAQAKAGETEEHHEHQ